MEKILRILASAVVILCACHMAAAAEITAPTPRMIEKVASTPHPRMLISDKDFKQYKKTVKSGRNPQLLNLHNAEMAQAAEFAARTDHLEYRKDKSGRRILHISREALVEIFSCAYAYRFSGEKKYLERAVSVMKDVCGFPDWNPSHFLDTAEMAAAVSLGYDWLYSKLSPEIRAMAERKLYEYALGDAVPKNYLKTDNNWNEVCNGGILCAALATCDVEPETATKRILESVESNRGVMQFMYAPDGIYPEGPGYWCYGTMYEIFLLRVLESCFGTDFGISGAPGFMETGEYELQSESGTGFVFNFCDNGPHAGFRPELYYFASKTGRGSLLYYDSKRTSDPSNMPEGDRLMPLFLLYAAECPAAEVPADGLYHGQGITPVAIARYGWDADNTYLGVKGGKGGAHHGHLDAGTFVYDAYGYRWAAEVRYPAYETSEAALAKFGGSLWDNRPDSWRWKISGYNNFFHSTISVNNKLHNPAGMATLEAVIDEPARKGATVDFTAALAPDLTKAVRTSTISRDGELEITDILTAGAYPAFIRWNLTTPAKAEVTGKGIRLTQGETTLLLKAEGAKVRYTLFPSSTDPSETPLTNFDKGTELTVCGFTLTVPKRQSVTITTRFTKIK